MKYTQKCKPFGKSLMCFGTQSELSGREVFFKPTKIN